MKYCTNQRYLDYIHIPSKEYANNIAVTFKFPIEKNIVTPFGIPDYYHRYKGMAAPDGYDRSEYYFSVRRSNRDFDFLIRAWQGIDQKLVIASDTYIGDMHHENMEIRKDISADDQYQWIMNCKALVIPIDVPGIASGDTALLTGMSFGKIVVVTKPSTLAEMYIENGVDGITVEEEESQFKKVIEEIEMGKYDNIKQNSRNKYLMNYSREMLARSIATKVEDC